MSVRLLATCFIHSPFGSEVIRVSDQAAPVAFVRQEKTRPLGSIFWSGPLMGSLVLRPGDSLTILKMALSVSFIRLVSFTNVTQATGR